MVPVTNSTGRAGLHGFTLLLVLLLPHAAAAAAPDELIVGVTLNEVDKGVFYALHSPDGDLLFAEEDLRAMGFRPLAGEPQAIGGKPYRSLRSLAGVTFAFNSDTVAVRITAPPGLLAMQTIDFLAGTGEETEYPISRSAFFNYRLNYRTGDDFGFSGAGAAMEAGGRRDDLLFLTNAVYSMTQEDATFVRLLTRASWEDRGQLRRLSFGDFTAPAADLWASPTLGGISFSKLYKMNPYQVRYPTFGLAGQATLPAEVRVYLDGVLVRAEKVAPGEFELRNLDSFGGSAGVEVVIKDAFGRETTVTRPFYFTDKVLRHGLHEYSYNLGWIRENYGSESFDYGSAALCAFHRYGLTDAATLGLTGEAGGGVVSAGPTLSLVAGSYGTFQFALSAGQMDGEAGYAGLAAYEYQRKRITTRLRIRRFSAEHRTIMEETSADRAGAQFEAGIGYGTEKAGSFMLAYNSQWMNVDADRTRVSADYNISLFGKVGFFATIGFTREGGGNSTSIYTGLSYFPGEKQTVSARYLRQYDKDRVTLDFSRDLTDGEGLAWKAAAEWREDGETLSPSAEYHDRRGILTGDLTLTRDDEGRVQNSLGLSAAGSILATGGAFGLGRPVQDSFALVKVGKDKGLPGVRVYAGSSLRGTTGEDGTIFVPEIGSYVRNRIAIEPKDIPIGYSIDRVTRVVAPAERSGSLLIFPAAPYQAVTGKLSVTENGGRVPMEYVEVRVQTEERSWISPAGRGGEFFLEDVGTDRAKLFVRYRGVNRSCAIVIPRTEELIVDLGDVSCDTVEAAFVKTVTGRLFVAKNGEIIPMADLELQARAGERSWIIRSGKAGEFRLDNVKPGKVTVTFRYNDRNGTCVIEVPETEEYANDVGEVSCEIAP